MKALITGVTGQDGSYLSELLLEEGYEVHGIKRRSSSINTTRIDHIFDHPRFTLHYGDLTDSMNLVRLMAEIRPDEVYNLGAQSHVAVSFETPEYTANSDAIGTLRLLEAIKTLKLDTKFYQASTSEMFGITSTYSQSESTPFHPASPYGVAKLYAHWITRNYREAYGMFASTGILFNHESPRRGETFVTSKIVNGLAAVKRGEQQYVKLGNLNAMRDWGHAKDFVRAMHMIMQHHEPDDFVIATGYQYSVRDFVEAAAQYFDMTIEWSGWGRNERGIDIRTGKTIVVVDSKYFRPLDVVNLLGDSTKAREVLGWKPEITFDELVKDMCINGKV